VSHDRAARAIRTTRGVVAAVSDREILAAKAVIDGAGIGCEPASAASLAGLRQLVRRGIVRPRDSVVAVLTGHLLKDPHAARATPVVIAPRIAEVERVLRSL
jgi:threonine synthase